MSDILIRRTHGMTQAKARKAAEQIADELAAEFDMRHAWEGSTLNFSRTGVHGSIVVGAKEVEVRAKLGFLLAYRAGGSLQSSYVTSAAFTTGLLVLIGWAAYAEQLSVSKVAGLGMALAGIWLLSRPTPSS